MAIPLSGTFRYVAIVPDNFSEATPWVASMCEPIERTGSELRDARLVGYSPRVEISEAGLTPDTPLGAGQRVRPKVLRSLITLSAAERKGATASAASFHVDRSLTSRLRPGDELYMARTSCGGFGLSIIRNSQLIVGVGALTAVPLGNNVRVSVPGDLITNAEANWCGAGGLLMHPGQTLIDAGRLPEIPHFPGSVAHRRGPPSCART